jgi:hypothetical protein
VLVWIRAQVQEVLRGPAMRTVRLQVTLRNVEPAVVRVIDVPAAAAVPELHDLLQAAFGWWDYHLHQFVTADGATYGMDIPGEERWPEDLIDETGQPLRKLGERFTYLYDFGDGWTHDVVALGDGSDEPGCIGGQGACPPEDCGGPGGYAELLSTLADPNHDDHEHMTDWVGDRLRPFDREHVDGYVKRMVGSVPATVRLLLDLIGAGVRLTAAGRLPRAIVRQMQENYPGWHLADKPAATEDDLWPLAELHGVLRRAGLLRLRNRVLAPTKSARDDSQIVRRLRSYFEPHAFGTMLVEITAALLASRGPQSNQQLGALVLPELGHRWSIEARPITERDVQRAIHRAAALMQALDLVDAAGPVWSAGPSARTLLPGAALRAEVWGRRA